MSKKKLLPDKSGDPIFIHDEKGRILMVNVAATAAYGYTFEEFSSMSFTDLDNSPGSGEENLKFVICNGIAKFQTQHICKNRSVMNVNVNAKSIELCNKKAIISVCRKISAKENSMIADDHKSMPDHTFIDDKFGFMSILAHDLKSPFNTILGFSDLLLKNLRKYDINQIEMELQLINKTAMQTYSLLEQLLLWSNAQTGKIPFEPVQVNVKSLLNDIIDIHQIQLKQKEIIVKCTGFEQLKVYADEQMLTTILRNLLSNAIKFTKPGGIIMFEGNNAKEGVVISVVDNGIGMCEETIKNLFCPGMFSSRTGTANEKGTGFGLLLCKDFIHKHGGRIWAESKPGEGSKFSISLPMRNHNYHEN